MPGRQRLIILASISKWFKKMQMALNWKGHISINSLLSIFGWNVSGLSIASKVYADIFFVAQISSCPKHYFSKSGCFRVTKPGTFLAVLLIFFGLYSPHTVQELTSHTWIQSFQGCTFFSFQQWGNILETEGTISQDWIWLFPNSIVCVYVRLCMHGCT